MSSGGLLEKAAKQQTGDANLRAPPNTAAISTADEGGSNSTMRLIGLIFGGMVVPYFIVMWFGGVFLGDDTATTVSVGFLSFVVLAIAELEFGSYLGDLLQHPYRQSQSDLRSSCYCLATSP